MAQNNPFPGENNTGHIWDDNLRELKNPPPRWWMLAFWASVIWWFTYGVLYPFVPMGDKATKGILGWTQIGEYQEGVAEVQNVRKQFEDKLKGMTAKQILADANMTQYVGASAKVLFGDNCSACHGAGGVGNPGFPVLADDDWLYGGDIETLVTTITNGRKGVMTAHGKIVNDKELNTLVNFVVGMSKGKKMDDDAAGKKLFMEKGCIACHGVDAKGMTVMGSANLTDGIFRFVDEGKTIDESVKYTIMHGVNDPTDPQTREAIMPSFKDRGLSPVDINKLAVYVHRFGGGK